MGVGDGWLRMRRVGGGSVGGVSALGDAHSSVTALPSVDVRRCPARGRRRSCCGGGVRGASVTLVAESMSLLTSTVVMLVRGVQSTRGASACWRAGVACGMGGPIEYERIVVMSRARDLVSATHLAFAHWPHPDAPFIFDFWGLPVDTCGKAVIIVPFPTKTASPATCMEGRNGRAMRLARPRAN